MPPCDTAGNDALPLERVAVGPYCVFDILQPHPLPSPQGPQDGPPETMEGPMIPDDCSFPNAARPWMTTSGDDMTLAAPSADDYPRNDWNEWMSWDPAASQPQDVKPMTAGAPVCFPKDQRQPLFNRRQNSHMANTPLALQSSQPQTSAALQHPMQPTSFTFGGDIEQPPAFDFDGNTLSSPSSGGGQQQNGFYSPPMWDQQRPKEQALFSPQRLDQPAMSSATMPTISTPSLHHSPGSLNNGPTDSSSATSSPEPIQGNPKKRKSASVDDGEQSVSSKKDKQPPVKKTAHNMIEKRYRTNLNDKIAALRDSVPSLRVMSRPNGGNEEDDDPEDLEGLTPAHKLNKATVLSKATEYIRHLEKRNKRLADEVTTLKGRLDSYEKMAISGPMALHGAVGTPDGNRYHEDPFSHHSAMVQQAVSGPPQGMIPVPESMASLHRGLPPQPHYAPQPGSYAPYPNGHSRPMPQGPPMVNGRRSSAMMGKLMVGSLAGLMIMEGFAEREESSETPAGRGLFAIPINLASILAPQVSLGSSSASIPLAKLLLIAGAFFYLIVPLLNFQPKQKKKASSTIMLSRAPSLASPVEVRRKAWLTAIQTVWVPQHNFLMEVAALSLKMLKLSTRKIIGWDGYALLTGITREQEAARVKAWQIALDAQLTGGDAEISKSRLVLTLMASGTLPDTPAGLMLKALHIRVLLWELARTSIGGWHMLNDLSAKIARKYWNAARSEHKIAANMAGKSDSVAEPLPPHLAALLEMECDEVLLPTIVQRAYNLAWNKDGSKDITLDETMDGVVEDFAICSPLDALAAWWSCYILKRGLTTCLASRTRTPKESVKQDLDLAARTAPPTSQAHARALVAQAVIIDENRSRRIAEAVEVLPLPASPASPTSTTTKSSRTVLMNLVGEAPAAADVRKALTFAKCHDLAISATTEARRRAIFLMSNTSLPESSTTLLSFVAGYRVLTQFMQDPVLQAESSAGLERLSSSLRMWVGHEVGRRSGLSNKVRGRIVNTCLDASKTLVGIKEQDVDDGYVSSSVKGD